MIICTDVKCITCGCTEYKSVYSNEVVHEYECANCGEALTQIKVLTPKS